MKGSIERRRFLAMSSLALLGPSLGFAGTGGEDADSALFLSAASRPGERHWVRGFSPRPDGRGVDTIFAHRLPGRAHHIAVHEGAGLYAVIARRPGTYLMVGDLSGGAMLRELRVPDGRHLYGHGVFSPDGRYFYAVENDYRDTEGDSGRLVTWEFRRRGQAVEASRVNDYPTHGVGPHELLLMPDGRTLAVANGGIRTHPDSGREKLNLDTMRPSLVYLDRESGELLEQRRLAGEYHQASIRHIDVDDRGRVALAMQHQGLPFEQVPLVALHERGGAIRIPDIPAETQRRMNQYCGSVRFGRGGRYFAVSCPRGGMITFWDGERETFLKAVASRDGCGVCAHGSGFLYTAGTGRVSHYDPATDTVREIVAEPEAPLFWDNHLTKV